MDIDGGQPLDYDYDPPDPETRNVFNGFRNYINVHGAQIPDSFLQRLEEAPLPYHRDINHNAQPPHAQAPQAPHRNFVRAHTLLPAAGASRRNLVLTNVDRERDRKEGKEMEQEKNKNRKEGRGMEQEKNKNIFEGRGMEQEKNKNIKEGRGMEQDKDKDGKEGKGKEQEKNKNIKEGRGMEQDKDKDGKEGKGKEQAKNKNIKEGRGMEQDKDKNKDGKEGIGMEQDKDKDGKEDRGMEQNKDKDGKEDRGMEQDGNEGKEMEQEKNKNIKESRGMEEDKDKDGKEGKEMEHEKNKNIKEGRGMEEDKDKDKDGKEGKEMEQNKDRDKKKGKEVEQDKYRDRKNGKEIEQDKEMETREGKEMEQDKDKEIEQHKDRDGYKGRDKYRSRDKDGDSDRDRKRDGKKYRERGGDDNDMRRKRYGVHRSPSRSRSSQREWHSKSDKDRNRDTNRDRDGRRLSGGDSDTRRERYGVHRSHSRGRSRQREQHRKSNKDRDRDRDGDSRKLSDSDGDKRREREVVRCSRSRSRSRRRERNNRNGIAKHDLTSSPPHPPRYSPCRVGEERRTTERVSPPPQCRRESGREVGVPAEDPNDWNILVDDIWEFYNPGNNQEFNEMYTHPHEPLADKIHELFNLKVLKVVGSPSREAIDAASAKQVELLAKYNNYLQIEQELKPNLKQSTDSLISAMKRTKKLKERQFSCTQQRHKLQNEYSTLLEKMTPINKSWMDITKKELVLITAVSDNLKSMETADGFNEIDKLNAESQELQRQLEQIRENGLEIRRQLQSFREEEKNIANKLIENITLSNSNDSSLKSEEEILKIRMEQHKSLMGELQDARLKSETAKKELECARQELFRLCPDLANKHD